MNQINIPEWEEYYEELLWYRKQKIQIYRKKTEDP